MTKLLFDCPGTLYDALDNANVQFAIRDFVNLLSETELEAAPFVEQAQEAEFWARHGARPLQNSFQFLSRFLNHCRRSETSVCTAVPQIMPIGAQPIQPNWQRGLRDQLPNDWRSPQVIVTSRGGRRLEWPAANEIGVLCHPCNGQAGTGPHNRPIVTLEEYQSHPYALADHDPWDVRCTEAPSPHPCYLPCPLFESHEDPCSDCMRRVPISELNDAIDSARKNGGRSDDRYFFIPPITWRVQAITPAAWRQGHAFPRRPSPERRNKVGFVDYENYVWVWHPEEGHWDVQRGGPNNYDSVNHLGEILASHRP